MFCGLRKLLSLANLPTDTADDSCASGARLDHRAMHRLDFVCGQRVELTGPTRRDERGDAVAHHPIDVVPKCGEIEIKVRLERGDRERGHASELGLKCLVRRHRLVDHSMGRRSHARKGA